MGHLLDLTLFLRNSQQRIFAVQLFELHRLIKVKLIQKTSPTFHEYLFCANLVNCTLFSL